MAGDLLTPFLPKLPALVAGVAVLCLALAAGWSLDARAYRAESVAIETRLESAQASLAAMEKDNAALRAVGLFALTVTLFLGCCATGASERVRLVSAGLGPLPLSAEFLGGYAEAQTAAREDLEPRYAETLDEGAALWLAERDRARACAGEIAELRKFAIAAADMISCLLSGT